MEERTTTTIDAKKRRRCLHTCSRESSRRLSRHRKEGGGLDWKQAADREDGEHTERESGTAQLFCSSSTLLRRPEGESNVRTTALKCKGQAGRFIFGWYKTEREGGRAK